MTYLSWTRLALIALVAAALGWALTRFALGAGRTPLSVPWSVTVVCGAAGLVAIWLGWAVRQYLKGKRPSLDGMRAARTAVYAQAVAYAGACVTGGFGGYALGVAMEWSHAPRREVAITALVAAGAGLVMAVCGYVAERWCRTGGPDDAAGSAA